MIATFFGHRDTPSSIQPKLEELLIDLIESNKALVFYVGCQGRFDAIVMRTLKKLKEIYPYIQYSIVLAYMPGREDELDPKYYENTILPEGIEKAPPKFAISKRNHWMLKDSEYVITYVTHNYGGAAQFKILAEKKGKKVINLADTQQKSEVV